MSDFSTFLHEKLLPKLPTELNRHYQEKYPNITLRREEKFVPLSEVSVFMLVAYTGTGKTTTLDELALLRESGEINYREDIPTRRELADWLIIPSAQVLSGEPIQPVKDRTERFKYTYCFAEAFPGGSALVYSLLYYQWNCKTPLLSDGIRGTRELIYTLSHCGDWNIIELWVDLATRLQRLSRRDDEFDRVESSSDLSFLPEQIRSKIQELLHQGVITSDAVSIVKAEAANYGIEPFQAVDSANYHRLNTHHLSPKDVASKICQLMQNK